ncbi:MAG: IclR family transcriptional regulator [Chloroflexi bacterium]|nr:IclR family transcriptional regulator [Chloroflexota bacterium]
MSRTNTTVHKPPAAANAPRAARAPKTSASSVTSAAPAAPVAEAPRRPGRPRRAHPADVTDGTYQSADRMLAVLELFTDERPWLRVGDVAVRIGVSDSTASRLLARLEARGFVERQHDTGFYALGPRVLTLAGVAMNHSEIRRAALQEMHRLVYALGLGVNLAVLRDGAVFYLGNLDGRRAPRHYTLLGRRYPLHATALGKVLLAWRSAEEVEALVAAPDGRLTRYTANTVGGVRQLQACLDAVRQRGYATECEELAMGRACVAAPVRNRRGAIVAALSISGPVRAVNLPHRETELAAAAADAAMHISERLGFVMAPLAVRPPLAAAATAPPVGDATELFHEDEAPLPDWLAGSRENR